MGGDEIDIREASLDDVDILATIGSNSFRDAYQDHSNAEDLRTHLEENFSAVAVRDEIEQHGRHYLLVSVNGRPGGIAKFRSAACPAGTSNVDAMELQQLYVLADMQRHGLGRRLVDAVRVRADESEANGLWLSVWEDADWAIEFYQKCGFVEVATTDFTVGSTTYTDLLMWLPLMADTD
jgi:GNAT superfamily N-acetyltransferase